MARTAVLIGGSGYVGGGIGRTLTARGYTVVSVGRAEFDVLARPVAELTELLGGVDLVVNAAGALWQVTDQEMVAANIVLVQRLLSAIDAMARPAPLIQLGSAYEYGVAQAGGSRGVDEPTPPRPESAYGRTKLAATECLTRWPGRGVVLRCSTVVGAERRAPVCSGRWRIGSPIWLPTRPHRPCWNCRRCEARSTCSTCVISARRCSRPIACWPPSTRPGSTSSISPPAARSGSSAPCTG
ncbi:NAD-dependent epimerase/dehydratase family protein [Nocardia colli]|uniref:NAD-dependent epimerase/dehydratase family protein n=1 Tax=Nocardia colli TaxID=2545717 RepID=UPI00168D87EE|nr:NAD-dependent epimerase/dehydratase family protein [Nocardia colli]